MPSTLETLDPNFRAARTLQAPQHVQFDHATGTFEVSSAAFKKQSDGSISVDLEEPLAEDGLELDAMYGKVPRAVGLVAHKVSTLTEAGFAVRHDPIPDNAYHGLAVGNLSRKARQQLAATCEIIRPLDAEAAQEHLAAQVNRNQALKPMDF